MSNKVSEKAFESAFIAEVGNNLPHQYIHSIDQILEAIWGFDAMAFFPPNHPLWRRLGAPHLRGRLMRDLAGYRNVRANLFIQFKKSDRRYSKKSKPYKYWRASYYEYRIDQVQLQLLEELERRTNSTAVIYAAPVFHLASHLVQYKQNNTIIANSNLVHAHQMSGHKRYTFINTTSGVGFSEPEEISTLNFLELIAVLSKQNERKTFLENLTELSSKITDVCEEYRLGDYLVKMSELRSRPINEYIYPDDDKYINELAKIQTFLEIANARWSIVFE